MSKFFKELNIIQLGFSTNRFKKIMKKIRERKLPKSMIRQKIQQNYNSNEFGESEIHYT